MFFNTIKKYSILFVIHISIHSFIAPAVYGVDRGYTLAISTDQKAKKSTVEVTKDGVLASSAMLPFGDNGKYVSNIRQLAHYFTFLENGHKAKISLEDGPNSFQITFDPQGNVGINKLHMAESFLLNLQGQRSVYANSPIKLNSHFELRAPRSSFKSDKAAYWSIGGQSDFLLSGGTFELWNAIESVKNITIEAQTGLMPYGPIVVVEGKTVKGWNKAGDTRRTCVESSSVGPVERPFLRSLEESINLRFDQAKVDGGAIVAQKHLVIEAEKDFKLRSACNTYDICRTGLTDTSSWIPQYGVRVWEDQKKICEPGVLSAGKNIYVTIGDKSCILDAKNKPCSAIPDFMNEGIIRAGELFHASSTNKKGQLVNQSPAHAEKRSYSSSQIPLADCIKHNQFLKSPPTGSRFLIEHALLENEEALRPFNELCFVSKSSKALLTGHERIQLSPKLQAEALITLFLQKTGLPSLAGHRDNNFPEQLRELQETGLWCALVNGKLENIQGDGSGTSQTEPSAVELMLTPGRKKFLAQRIASLRHGGGNFITPEELHKKIACIKAGTHVAVLPYSRVTLARPSYSFIYYEVIQTESKKVLIPMLHIGRKDFEANAQMGSIVAHTITIEDMNKVLNKGTIRAINKVRIQAQTVINESSLAKKYSITTPLAGGEIIGFDIEIEVPQGPLTDAALDKPGIYNRGGTILAKHKVTLHARQGDIVNEAVLGSHIVKWDPGFLGTVFGHKSSSHMVDYYPGRITSDGDMELIAQAGYLINEGSKILAGGDAQLKGYAGALFETLMSKYTLFSGASVSGLSIEQIVQEAVNYSKSEVSAAGNLNVESDGGKIKCMGAAFDAGKDASFNAQEGNEFGTQHTETESSKTKIGLEFLQLKHVKTIDRQDNHVKTEIHAGGSIVFDSELDNTLEAVIVNAGQTIHLFAQRDNAVKGVEQVSSTQTNGFTFGVSFFGLEALKALGAGDGQQALWALNDEDPLLRALHRLKDSSGAFNTIAEGTYTSIEAVRLLVDYCKTLQSGGSTAGMLGRRLGILDGQGSFNPTMRFRLGHFDSHQTQTSTLSSELKGQNVNFKSGRNVLWLDGTQINAKTVEVEAHNLHASAGTTQTSAEYTSAGVSGATDGTFGVDGSTGQEKQTVHHNTKVTAQTLSVNITGNLDAAGAEFQAKILNVDVKGNSTFESPQDTYESSSYTASAYAGAAGYGGSYSQASASDKSVSTPSGMEGEEEFDVKVAGTATFRGAYAKSNDPDATLEAPHLNYEDIEDKANSTQFIVAAGVANQCSNDFIRGIFEAGFSKESQEGTTRATVGENIHIKTESDTSGLNRDINRIQTKKSKKKSNFRIVIPFVSAQRLGELYQELCKTNDPIERSRIEHEIEEIVEKEAEIKENAQPKEATSQKQAEYSEEAEEKRSEPESAFSQQETGSSAENNPQESDSTTPQDYQTSQEFQDDPAIISSIILTDKNAQQVPATVFGLSEEQLKAHPDLLASIIRGNGLPDGFTLLDFKSDKASGYYFFTIVNNRVPFSSQYMPEPDTEELSHFFSKVLKIDKAFIVDFGKQFANGFGEGYLTLDLSYQELLPKNVGGVVGRKVGRLVGLLRGIYEIAKAAPQLIDNFAAIAKDLYQRGSSFYADNQESVKVVAGAATLVLPIAIVEAAIVGGVIVCVGTTYYLLNNYVNQETGSYYVDNELNAPGGGQTEPPNNQPQGPSQETYFENQSKNLYNRVIPDKVKNVLKELTVRRGSPLPGYKGGKTFQNDGRSGCQKLPQNVKYKEYDVDRSIQGQKRGIERLVLGEDGSAYYTDDHYMTFQKIE